MRAQDIVQRFAQKPVSMRKRVKDVFDVLKCEEGGVGNAWAKWEKQKK